jgi:hypothetical protein
VKVKARVTRRKVELITTPVSFSLVSNQLVPRSVNVKEVRSFHWPTHSRSLASERISACEHKWGWE